MLSEATWPRWYGDDAQGTVEILNGEFSRVFVHRRYRLDSVRVSSMVVGAFFLLHLIVMETEYPHRRLSFSITMKHEVFPTEKCPRTELETQQ